MIRFGPSGNCDAFYADGNKESCQMPKWLNNLGLSAYEYSFSLGRFLRESTAKKIRDEAIKNDILVSVHAPYYINFSNNTMQSKENNYKFLIQSLDGLKMLNGRDCVFHIGSQMKMSRDIALSNIENNFKEFLEVFDTILDYQDLFLCPETMGKYTQIGSPMEIFNICSWHKNLIPTLDFGHINCIMQGKLRTKKDYLDIFNQGIDILGYQKIKNCHIHFSKIQYNEKGEMMHLTFEDNIFGPNYEPMLDAIIQLKLEPTIISESKGTQGPDAKTMLEYYLKNKN